MAAFRSPTNAVLCGMAIQDRLSARNARARRDRLALRIAVHLAEAREEEGGVEGPALDDLAAVVRAASPGEIRLTRGVYLAMTRGEVRLAPLAPLARPGEPMPLYRVERAGGAPPYGGREAASVRDRGPLARALAPLLDAIGSVRDGAAEGRLRAARRVSLAALSLGLGLAAAAAVAAALALLGRTRASSGPAATRLAGRAARRTGSAPPATPSSCVFRCTARGSSARSPEPPCAPRTGSSSSRT